MYRVRMSHVTYCLTSAMIICDLTHSYARRIWMSQVTYYHSRCETIFDMTHVYVTHDAFIYARRIWMSQVTYYRSRSDTSATTDSYVRRAGWISKKKFSCLSWDNLFRHSYLLWQYVTYVTWLIHMCHDSYVWLAAWKSAVVHVAIYISSFTCAICQRVTNESRNESRMNESCIASIYRHSHLLSVMVIPMWYDWFMGQYMWHDSFMGQYGTWLIWANDVPEWVMSHNVSHLLW